MRTVTVIFAFATLAAGFIVLERMTAPGDADRPAPASAEALSIAEVLANRAGLAVKGVVLAPRTGAERDFRGLHSAEGRLRPVYGRARVVCDGPAVGPACWEILYLEVDGQQVAHRVKALDTGDRATRLHDAHKDERGIETADTGKADTAPGSRRVTAAVVSPVTGRGTIEPPAGAHREPPLDRPRRHLVTDRRDEEPERRATGEVPIPAIRPRQAGQGRPPPDDGSDTLAKADYRPTHAVNRPIINVRVGPGTDKKIVARLPRGMRLSLIDRHDDWGRFVVLDGAASGREVWAALRVVKRLP